MVGDAGELLERARTPARNRDGRRQAARRAGDPARMDGCGAAGYACVLGHALALLPELADGPEASRLRSWVRGDLTRRGNDRATVHELRLGRVSAHAHGQVGRADATPRL